MSRIDDRDELIEIVTEGLRGSGHYIGTILAEDIAVAIIAAGFRRGKG